MSRTFIDYPPFLGLRMMADSRDIGIFRA